jgi:hypothetical protein
VRLPTSDIEASLIDATTSPPPPGPLRRAWEKIATVLAVIGLIDLSSQLNKWAALIHWFGEKYAIAREWLFGWLPFHIPPGWHDPVVLFLILFSVTNVGVRRRTGRTAISIAFQTWREAGEEIWTLIAMAFVFVFIPAISILVGEGSVDELFSGVGLIIFLIFLGGLFLAWRWVLTTVAIFCALIVANYIYLHWLA